jgi:hypothetical protein
MPAAHRILMMLLAIGIPACTTVSVHQSAPSGATQDVRIGRVLVDLDRATLEPDGVTRLEEIGTAAAVERKLGQYLQEGDLLAGDVDLHVRIDAFRLPDGARWLTGSMKGNDVLGAAVTLDRGETVLHRADVRVQLGAGDRSIGANYSADWAHGSMVDMLAWEIAWSVSGVVGGRGDAALLAAGKRDSVKRAILVLGYRGKLTYGELLKYAAMGKIGVENSDLSAKYDACSLRKVATLGLSSCAWDPAYR